jgi:serine/threonine protein kinase
MGRILVGYDQYLKREVAIKERHPDVAEDESIVRRFIGEAEITAQLEHPGVVPIHRISQGADGLPYYTMKMIKGETLQDAIKAYHRKPGKQELLNLVRRLVSVSKTIAFAHSKGVIHRDLKPANIMLGEHGETLVMDWGLAKPYNQEPEDSYVSVIHQTKQSRPELTMVGAIVGTPAFMSPEQANAEDNIIGPLSDVFSLGTVLYYLLAGQTAFAGRSTQDVLSKVRACKPTPPSQIKSNVPHGLESICLKAMAKLPENRYQGATEFADDLCRWLDSEPIAAEANLLSAKIQRWFSKYRMSLAGIVWVLILSFILACIGVWIVELNRDVSSDQKEEEAKTLTITRPVP